MASFKLLYLVDHSLTKIEPFCNNLQNHLYEEFRINDVVDERIALCQKCGVSVFYGERFYSDNAFEDFFIRKGNELKKQVFKILMKNLIDDTFINYFF